MPICSAMACLTVTCHKRHGVAHLQHCVATQHLSHTRRTAFKSTRATTQIVAAAYTDWFIPTNHREEYNDQSRFKASIEGTRSQKKLREGTPVETQQCVSPDVQRWCSVFQTTLHNKAITSHQKWPVNLIKGATLKASAVQPKQSITRVQNRSTRSVHTTQPVQINVRLDSATQTNKCY